MITVKYAAILEVTDDPNSFINFATRPVILKTTTQFTQEMGATVRIPASAVNQQIYSQNIDQLQMIFLQCDKEVQIKLVPTGGSLGATPSLTMLAGMPTLLAVKNIMEIYVSNALTEVATLTVQAVGNDI